MNSIVKKILKLFSSSSSDEPALLPSAMPQRQARGNHKIQFMKHSLQFISSLGRLLI